GFHVTGVQTCALPISVILVVVALVQRQGGIGDVAHRLAADIGAGTYLATPAEPDATGLAQRIVDPDGQPARGDLAGLYRRHPVGNHYKSAHGSSRSVEMLNGFALPLRQLFEPMPDGGHRRQSPGRQRLPRPHLDRQPLHGVDRLEAGFVGQVIADEYRVPAMKGSLLHEGTNDLALARTARLEL